MFLLRGAFFSFSKALCRPAFFGLRKARQKNSEHHDDVEIPFQINLPAGKMPVTGKNSTNGLKETIQI